MVSSLARDLWKLNTARSVEELTGHYRRLCKLYHPDLREPDQREQFERHMQALNEAYSQALERFNIFTFRNPHKPAGGNPAYYDELFAAPPATEPKPRSSTEQGPVRTATANAPRQFGQGNAYAMGEAARALGRALAVLSDARSFNSFKSASEQERKVYLKALPLLHDVARRFPSLREGRDALFYAGVCECNLRSFEFALHSFAQYQTRYAGTGRDALVHFYRGICRHRLAHFPAAMEEYGRFLETQPTGMFRHFLAVVEGFLQAACRGETPPDLPYA